MVHIFSLVQEVESVLFIFVFFLFVHIFLLLLSFLLHAQVCIFIMLCAIWIEIKRRAIYRPVSSRAPRTGSEAGLRRCTLRAQGLGRQVDYCASDWARKKCATSPGPCYLDVTWLSHQQTPCNQRTAKTLSCCSAPHQHIQISFAHVLSSDVRFVAEQWSRAQTIVLS